MSVVSNVILHYGHFLLASPGRKSVEGSLEQSLREVNTYFGDGGQGFVSIDDASLPRGWYGGTKMFEAAVAYGAFNYLTLGKLSIIEMMKMNVWPFSDEEAEKIDYVEDGVRVMSMLERARKEGPGMVACTELKD